MKKRYYVTHSLVELVSDYKSHDIVTPKGTKGIVIGHEYGTYVVMTENDVVIMVDPNLLTEAKMIPFEQAEKVIEGYSGHHCPVGHYQFNIKQPMFEIIPKVVQDTVSEEKYYVKYYSYMDDELQTFIDDMQKLFPWFNLLSGVWTAGRNGGWLVIQPKVYFDELITKAYHLKEKIDMCIYAYRKGLEEDQKKRFLRSLLETINECYRTKREVRKVAEQLMFIEKLIACRKKANAAYYSTLEPWMDLLHESIEEKRDEIVAEFEKREDIHMPDLSSFHNVIEKVVTQEKKEIEEYYTQAAQALNKVSSNYAVYAAMQLKMSENIQECDRIISSLKDLITDLDDAKSSMHMVQIEIESKAKQLLSKMEAA